MPLRNLTEPPDTAAAKASNRPTTVTGDAHKYPRSRICREPSVPERVRILNASAFVQQRQKGLHSAPFPSIDNQGS